MTTRYLTMLDCLCRAEKIASAMLKAGQHLVYGIPRGGIAAAGLVAQARPGIRVTADPECANAFVDDILDSGSTRKEWDAKHPGRGFYALVDKKAEQTEDWFVMPWEGSEVDSATDICVRLLQFIGEKPNRQGLQDTPRRFIRAWQEWASGYQVDEASLKSMMRVFEDGAENYDEMILLKGHRIYSHCEHHLAPFFGVAHVAYIPDGRIVGLSKIARVIEVYSRRLQVQERLTKQIADALEILKPKGIAVTLTCRHLCMESRGVCKAGIETTTSAMRGVFLDNPSAKAEFLNLAKD